jgi:hypothetical protein
VARVVASLVWLVRKNALRSPCENKCVGKSRRYLLLICGYPAGVYCTSCRRTLSDAWDSALGIKEAEAA